MAPAHAIISTMPGRDEWLDIAGGETDDLKERILTGYKGGKPFTPYIPTIGLPRTDTVLDFGCGLGRNFPYLTTIAAHVHGYDLPPMVERCRALGEPIDALHSEWADVRTRRYDLVFASLVLQHIETDQCRALLRDFAAMTPHVYLLTRARTDFGVPLLDLVAESEVYDPGPCRVVDHDSSTHQLRVIRELPFESARGSAEDVHYEMLLASRAPLTEGHP